MRETQTTRLLRYLREHPGSSGLEIVMALRLPKYTGRISDLRAAGVDVRCERDREGVRRYHVVESGPLELGL